MKSTKPVAQANKHRTAREGGDPRRAAIADFEIIIVGGGPAGSAAAIQLAQCGLGMKTLLIDGARFPRQKLCGGGVVRQADRLLSSLGVHIDVPAVPIHAVRFEYAGGTALHRSPHLFRVVRREEFDHALLREAERLGVTVHQGDPVSGVERTSGGVITHAGGQSYRARVVIGADGAKSVVRRALVPGRYPRRFVALEILTPMERPSVSTAGEAHTAVFDFRPATQGLRGYYWDFPSVRAGEPLMNRGIGGDDWGGGSLQRLFAEQLGARGVAYDRGDLQGATAPLYDPAVSQSAPHVLLAGDAVGIDPWFGEGISAAIGTGILAANAAVEGLASGDLAFGGYRRRVRDSAIGWTLRRSRATARTFYRAAPQRLGLMPWFGLSEVTQ